MKHLIKAISLAALVLISQALLSQTVNAQQYNKITYVHSDPDGTAFAATDEQGNIEWQIDHFPYGKEYENTQVARKSDISFAGKPYDEEIGLSYFGGRWYDPDLGRFTSIDPMPVNPEDYRTYNRYAYGFNNPYKYVDPDGNIAFLIPIAIFIAKEIAAEAASRATGGATDFLSVRRLGQKALKKGAQVIANRGQKKLARQTGPCCFVAGTQVLTETGYKNIEDVELGEQLWAKNTDTGEEAWKPVTKLWREPDRGIYEIQVISADGFVQKIEATDDHPFYVVGHGWKKTIELKEGDLLESNLGGSLTVKSVVNENRTDLTYNFTVADFSTYYVTEKNVLVHNCDSNIVRRFDTKKNIKELRKNGMDFDPNKGSGISSTTTNIDPVDPNSIRKITGMSREPEAFVDIDISGMNSIRKTTKNGNIEIQIQGNITPGMIRETGRVSKNKMSK